MTVSGLVTSVQRKITKRGDAWAMVTLEDLDGAIDVLLFPSTYQLASTYLAEDAIITVKGRLSRSKDQPEIHGQEVTVPDLSDGPSGPVVISLPSTRCTGPVVAQLRDVLGTHPGLTEVQLRLLTRNATTLMRLDDRLRVTPEPGAVRRPQAAPGPRMPQRLTSVLRQVATVLFLCVAAAALAGVVWQWVWTPPVGVAFGGDWTLDAAALTGDFSGTGWYVVVGRSPACWWGWRPGCSSTTTSWSPWQRSWSAPCWVLGDEGGRRRPRPARSARHRQGGRRLHPDPRQPRDRGAQSVGRVPGRRAGRARRGAARVGHRQPG